MQLVLYPVVLSGIADIRPKYCVSLSGQFLFPVLELTGMYVKLLGSLRQGRSPRRAAKAILALNAGE